MQIIHSNVEEPVQTVHVKISFDFGYTGSALKLFVLKTACLCPLCSFQHPLPVSNAMNSYKGVDNTGTAPGDSTPIPPGSVTDVCQKGREMKHCRTLHLCRLQTKRNNMRGGGEKWIFFLIFCLSKHLKREALKKRKGFLIAISPLPSFTLSQMFFPGEFQQTDHGSSQLASEQSCAVNNDSQPLLPISPAFASVRTEHKCACNQKGRKNVTEMLFLFKQVSVIFHVDLGLCPQVICLCQVEHENREPSPASDYSQAQPLLAQMLALESRAAWCG